MTNFFTGFLAKGTGSGSFVELTVAEYSRQPVTFGPMSGGEAYNTELVVFKATSPWPAVTQDALYDASGNQLLWWNTTANAALNAGQSIVVGGGKLALYFANVAAAPTTVVSYASAASAGIKPGGNVVTASTAIQIANGVLSATGGGTSAPIAPARTVVTFASTPAFDGTTNFATFDITLTAACAPTLINTTDNFSYTINLQQDATGGRVITWPAGWKWVGGTPLVLSTAANALDSVSLLMRGTVVWAVGAKGFA